jgi:hypothetical protein
MSLFFSLSAVLTSSMLLATPSQTSQSSGLEAVLEGFEVTGRSSNCVVSDDIKDIEVINNRTWVFEMHGDRAFVNMLSRSCRRANDPFNAIVGEVQGPRLCRGGRGLNVVNRAEAGRIDSRAVGAQPSALSNTCRLGRFVEYRKSQGVDDSTD